MSELLNRITQGDSLDALKTMDDFSVDLTVTSPPYDNLRTYNGYSFDFESIAKELYRVTSAGGVVVWNVNDKTEKGSETLTSFKQALYFKELGFNVHDTMIWEKTNPIPNDTRQNRYIQAFEYMFVFSKGKPKVCNYITEKSKLGGMVAGQGTARKKDGSIRQDRVDKRKGSTVQENKPLTNIWKFSNSTERGHNHPAMFPNKLAEYHILSWSNPGDIVLDIFGCSGTTAKMALLHNRNFIHLDISEEYCEIAQRRIDEALAQKD